MRGKFYSMAARVRRRAQGAERRARIVGRGARGAGRGATPPYWEHEAARGGGEGRGDIAAPIASEKVSPPTWI